ncbi:hypothetical protein [Natrinema caseinilyticum]|uniref:hypothetical protein n=1 Tax=Natrinema caseinilyticum TaxID=2961570 RepID=UPI0020C44A8D|nr:hypothetical protein [Natrinema caseinilyticum]
MMSDSDRIKRRNVLKSSGSAIVAGSGLTAATSSVQATHSNCGGCDSDERCGYAATIYDGCGGNDTGWSLANWTCVTPIDECTTGTWPFWQTDWIRLEDCTGPDSDECWIKKSELVDNH